VNAHPREFADDNSYFVITTGTPAAHTPEVQLFRDWLLSIAAAR